MLKQIDTRNRKSKPSGIILAWLGNNDKLHTKSIITCCIPSLEKSFAKIEAQKELLLLQLDYIGGEIKSMPVITIGLTRAEARRTVENELSPTIDAEPIIRLES